MTFLYTELLLPRHRAPPPAQRKSPPACGEGCCPNPPGLVRSGVTKLLIRFQKIKVTLGQASAFQPLLKITQNETNREVLDVEGLKARPRPSEAPSAAAQPVSRGAPRAGREGPVTAAAERRWEGTMVWGSRPQETASVLCPPAGWS